nr:type II toxin-antitoxin system VapC family toxin [Duganella sp. 1224]
MLLDTHVLLWCLQGNRRLSKAARSKLLSASALYISSASIWELAIKINAGKLQLDLSELILQIADIGMLELSISYPHAVQVKNLPRIHLDPFDRMLIAQATCESMTLLTADRLLLAYSPLVVLI